MLSDAGSRASVPERPGERHHLDPVRPGRAKRPRRLGDGRARGVDVVDEHDRAVGRAHGTERPGDVATALREGQAADVPVAWLDAWAGTLERLAQRYERRTGTTYWYEAERFGYRAFLEVDSLGFATRYPDLWVAEPVAAEAPAPER